MDIVEWHDHRYTGRDGTEHLSHWAHTGAYDLSVSGAPADMSSRAAGYHWYVSTKTSSDGSVRVGTVDSGVSATRADAKEAAAAVVARLTKED